MVLEVVLSAELITSVSRRIDDFDLPKMAELPLLIVVLCSPQEINPKWN